MLLGTEHRAVTVSNRKELSAPTTSPTSEPGKSSDTMADYHKSPPSMLSIGPVTHCGCHDGCAVLKRCICRRKQQLCYPSCHRGRRCCNSTIVDKSRTVTLDSSDEDTDEVNPITGKMWLPQCT